MYYTYMIIASLTFYRMQDLHVTRIVAVQKCYGLVCMIQTLLEEEIHCNSQDEGTEKKTPFIVM